MFSEQDGFIGKKLMKIFNILSKFLVTVMEAIVESDPTYEDMNWDRKTVVAANGLLKMYFSFTFIVSFIVTMNVMSIIKPISKAKKKE